MSALRRASGNQTRRQEHAPGLYKCKACEQPYTVTVGTVFEKSKIPLNKWLLVTFLMTSAKKGISAHQIHRTLGVTYKTAWFMCQRVREAMTPAPRTAGPIGGGGKTVEADETFVGGKAKNVHKASRSRRSSPSWRWSSAAAKFAPSTLPT